MSATKKLRIGVLLTILIVSLSVPTFLVGANRGYESNVSTQVPPSEEIITAEYSQDGSSSEPFVHTIGSLKVELVRGPSHKSPVVYVVVNATLYGSGGTGLQNRITRYHDDMEATGFSVYTWIMWAGNPEIIRSWFASETDLVGCVLVGDIPSAWYQMFHVPPIWENTTYEEFPIDLFYMDLDGAWFDEKVPPYPGTAGTDGIYDVHNASTGDVDPEIWIGRIKADDMADPEVGLVTNYFDKNHDYRTGSLTLPQRALVYIDDDWAPGTTVRDAVKEAYPDTTLVNDKNTTKKADYVDRLDDQWSWVHVMCHGNPGGHSFKILNATGHSVWEAPWMTWNDYRTGDYPVFFYNLFVCSAERFTSTNYLGGWVIFTPTYGLAAVGSTKTGGMHNDFELYDPLGDGDTLGEAFKDWFTATAESSRPWYYGMTISGDPTLRVSGKHLMTINTIGLTSATGVVHYTKNGVAKTGNIAGGSWSDYCDHGTTLSIDGAVTIGSDERYSTTDTHSWSVAEPRTLTVNYYHQYKPTITTSGLPPSTTATVTYVQNGVTNTKTGIWDSNSFNEWCDAGSTVSITNPVIVSSGERYYLTDTTSWTVSSAFSATVTYYHQFKVTCSVTTAGTGHQDINLPRHNTLSPVCNSYDRQLLGRITLERLV